MVLNMTDQEHAQWEEWYWEAFRRDEEARMYRECDEEDERAMTGAAKQERGFE